MLKTFTLTTWGVRLRVYLTIILPTFWSIMSCFFEELSYVGCNQHISLLCSYRPLNGYHRPLENLQKSEVGLILREQV